VSGKGSDWDRVDNLTSLPHKILEAASKAGIDETEKERSASYLHLDHSLVVSKVNDEFKGQIELMDTLEALEKYEWLSDLRFSLVDKDKDEYTKAAQNPSGGYFIRILPGAKVTFPLQSCLMITQNGVEQKVHNIIICEEGSEARIITGCSVHPDVTSGNHIGISEFFIRKNAKLHFTMIHNWAEETKVRPRSAARVEENGTFISNYILLNPVADLQMYPSAHLIGDHAKASFNSIIYARKNSLLDVGSKIVLSGKKCRGEVISRAVVKDSAKVIARGMLEASNSPAKAHLECRGLLLNDEAIVHAIPELVGSMKDVDLSHEAAVGKIADKEINYLMSRGISRDEATSVIVRGFLDVELMGLPEHLEQEVRELVDQTTEGL